MTNASTTVNPRLFVETNVGRGLLTSLALEAACFAIAGGVPVVGSWQAVKITDIRFIRAFGE